MTGAAVPDLFAALGLPRRFDVAAGDLEARFHERSRLLHPDRFARATPQERRLSLDRTTRLNQAYRTLRDPWARAEHLLALLDPGAPAAGADPAFLEEQLAAREALAAARSRGDPERVAAIAAAARHALSALERDVARHLDGAPDAPALASARALVARARFHRALLAEAEGAEGRGRAR
jgi:molecular chaperone HscB